MSASRPPPHPSDGGSSFFSDLFKRLPGFRSHSPKFLKEIREFEETLSQELESLKPKGEENILCMSWLASAVKVTLDMHAEAKRRIPPLQFPLLVSDEKWMNDYMDQTTRILEVCNALQSAISEMEQGSLLLRYACNTLLDAFKVASCKEEFLTAGSDNKQPEAEVGVAQVSVSCTESQKPSASHVERLLRSRNSLAEWLNSHTSAGNINSNRCISILKDMIQGLVPPKEKEVARGKGFLYALYGANATAVFVLYVLVLAFSHEEQLLSLSVQLPAMVLWSTSISDLVELAKGKAKCQLSNGSGTCLADVNNIRTHVQDLLNVVDQLHEGAVCLPADEVKKVVAMVNILSWHLDELEKRQEDLASKVTEMFRVIVASRSELLEKLGDIGSDTI